MTRPSVVQAAGQPSGSTSASVAAPGPAGELPPRGEGVAGDRAIQRLLERSWPADLPDEQAATLLALGRKVLLADATGLDRGQFPTAFPEAADGAETVTPAFTRIRIQAAVARQDTRSGRAVVHLVWAAADRGGTYTDGRLTDIPFHHARGDGTWTPLPPTTPS
ncbi:hypothetical protein ACFCWG_32360 [Streptomyces sp. NPDC056390]|uniref:hypothetical protein n=1 Tax=Streptomyces sp. NPDC056390 TaxID=3345806 RepID=UPI0035D86722